MNRIINTFTSLLLVFAMICTVLLPVSAARPGTEFLSELQMAQASTADEAKKMLTDAGYKVIDKNFNNGGGDAVYIGYKTSTNVEDAITDISVMNMYGGYSITDYDVILQDSLSEYKEMIKFFRTAANEFAENYKAGTKEAKLAYRQLNYYYVEENKQKIFMGDYMLNFPENDEDFANILLKGNWNILANIRTLLAMGVGSSESTLSERIAAITNDESVYGNSQHYNDAKTLYQTYIGIEKDLEKIKDTVANIEADTSLNAEEKENLIESHKVIAAKYIAFKVSLESLPYKDSTYGEYLEANPTVTDYSVFYPIIEAMTPGQRALVPFGQSVALIIYDAIAKADEDIESDLREIENEFNPISIYLGTDLSIFEGSFAVTTEALRKEGATGNNWINSSTNSNSGSLAYAIGFGVGGAITLAASAVLLKISAPLLSQYNTITSTMNSINSQINALEASCQNAYNATVYQNISFDANETFLQIENLQAEYAKTSSQLNGLPSGNTLKAAVAGSVIGVVVGLVMIGISIYNIVKIVNSYKVEYLDIPTNMIDCKETANGDRFIRYSVVESFYKDGGATKSRPGDTNGYNGKQWVALYYTKNYEAGKCLLAKYDLPTHETDFGKYAPVHEFGKSNTCYNLNTHSNKSDAENVYLSFQTSNAKKAAETDVPSVVGSIIEHGAIAISCVVGIGAGMGIMALVNKRKSKKQTTAE